MADKREDILYSAVDSIIYSCDKLAKTATRLRVALELSHANFDVKVTSNLPAPTETKTFADHMLADAAIEFAKMDWQTIWNEHSQKVMAERMSQLEKRLRHEIELIKRNFESMPAELPAAPTEGN